MVWHPSRAGTLRPGIGLAIACFALAGPPAHAQVSLEPDSTAWANPDSAPSGLVACGDAVYFLANDGIHGRELWRSDGTAAGTRLVADLEPDPRGLASDEAQLRCFDGFLYFVFRRAYQGPNFHLLFYKPNSGALVPVEASGQGPMSLLDTNPYGRLTAIGDHLYIATNYAVATTWLWRCALGENQAIRMPAPPRRPGGLHVLSMHSAGAHLAVRGDFNTFEVNAPPTQMLWNVEPQSGRIREHVLGPGTYARAIAGTEQWTLIEMDSPASELGREPWVLWNDGTLQLVKDIHTGRAPSLDQAEAVPLANGVLFAANDGIHGIEPWFTDGTEDGTHMVADLYPGPEGSLPGIFIGDGSRAYFQALTPGAGHELWRTDGTAGGTALVLDINPGPGSSHHYRPVFRGPELFFSAADPIHGEELWATDGTPEGTRLIADIIPGPESASPYEKAVLGDDIFFSATDGIHGVELWISDGTNAGTRLVRDISPVRGPNPSSNPEHLTAVGGLVFFVVRDAKHGSELWVTDGTQANTRIVKDIYPGPASSRPAEFLAFNGVLLFQAESPDNGLELWQSDGTPEGTLMVADIQTGPGSSNPHELTAFDATRLVFSADDGVHGPELYEGTWDGARIDVRMVADLNEGPAGSRPGQFTIDTPPGRPPQLYFVAEDGYSGRELWVYDGVNRPRLVADILNNHQPIAGQGAIHTGPAGVIIAAGQPAGTPGLYRVDPDTQTRHFLAPLAPGASTQHRATD